MQCELQIEVFRGGVQCALQIEVFRGGVQCALQIEVFRGGVQWGGGSMQCKCLLSNMIFFCFKITRTANAIELILQICFIFYAKKSYTKRLTVEAETN